jgi:hypothetical protein
MNFQRAERDIAIAAERGFFKEPVLFTLLSVPRRGIPGNPLLCQEHILHAQDSFNAAYTHK